MPGNLWTKYWALAWNLERCKYLEVPLYERARLTAAASARLLVEADESNIQVRVLTGLVSVGDN